MTVALCRDCGRKIYLGPGIFESQLVECPHCGIRLKVVNLAPLELDWASLEPAEGEENWHWESKVRHTRSR